MAQPIDEKTCDQERSRNVKRSGENDLTAWSFH
jgi:hypothetical protein